MTPLFTWAGQRGTEEWVQYDFNAPQQVSSTEVYWGERAGGNGRGNNAAANVAVKLPAAWKVQYHDGDQWKDVHAAGAYGVAADRFNHVDFEPVTTSGLRLVTQLAPEASAGIFEWRVNSSQGKQIEDVPEIAPTETFQLDGNALVWTIELRNKTGQPVEVGDLGLPLPFNTQYNSNKLDTYTKRLIRHAFIGGGGSYVFGNGPTASGPTW